MAELHNHATRISGSCVFRTSLEARSEVEKKTALVAVSLGDECSSKVMLFYYLWLIIKISIK